MRSPRFTWFAIVLAAGALALAGCSKHVAQLTGPLAAVPSGPAPVISRAGGGRAIEGAYIVVFRQSVGESDVDRVVSDVRIHHAVVAERSFKHALHGFSGHLSSAQLVALQNDPRVEYIEQDQIAHAIATQANPPSWGLDRSDQVSLPLSNSYTYNQTGAGVDAYMIDTGIRFTHSDLGGRAVTGVDEITIGGTAADGNGHGTHTAGTTGGNAYGMAKGVRLIAVRVLDNSGSGSYSQVIAGIDWVTADHTTRPAVANMSLGGPISTALDAAVRNSIADGVVYVVSAGNSSADASTQSPADVAEAITVGATDVNDGWASFSNFGAGVDILAPGVNITSAWNTSDTATNTISGTSMAAPHVTGAAALYLEAHPGSTPAQVQAGLIAAASLNKIAGVPGGTANRLLYALIAGGPPPPPPAAPTLIAPADGSTGVSTSPTFSWNASSGATSYELQVSASPTFATLVSDQPGLSGTTAGVSGLAGSTIYYWRVNATNAGGTSGWSATFSFTTGAGSPPAAPSLASPANGLTGVSRTPTLSWNASAGASSYHVQVSTTSTFTALVYDQSGVTGTSVTLPQLGSRVTYYWQVNATNTNGTSAYSGTWNFRTRRN